MAQMQFNEGLGVSESDLVRRAIAKDETAIRAILRTNNLHLYRVARSIVKDDGEAEDVLQEAYLRAFSALSGFRGDSSLSTWLTRIVINEALQRRRRTTEQPAEPIDPTLAQQAQIIPFPFSDSRPASPESVVAQREICLLLERAIDDLPDEFRTVLMARVVEGMSLEETAELLGLKPATVKTRLHRARRQLKAALSEHVGALFSDVFPFAGRRCQRLTDIIVKRLQLSI